jgi:Family of unknown function (DUF5677)
MLVCHGCWKLRQVAEARYTLQPCCGLILVPKTGEPLNATFATCTARIATDSESEWVPVKVCVLYILRESSQKMREEQQEPADVPQPVPEEITVEMSGEIGVADLFRRDAPAELEGPQEAWEFAKAVIDHGCYILVQSNQLRAGNEVADLTIRALLRRALLTAEAIRVNLASGLEEPAFVLFRTLMEVELNLKLLVSDKSGKMALRLAAFHYLTGRRHNHRLLDNKGTREKLRELGAFDWTRSTTKRMDAYFETPVFDSIRADLRLNRNWHGMDSIQDAFQAIGAEDDYLQLYDLFSPFVHSSNLDFDFEGFDEQERPQLKALPQRDPIKTLGHLKGTLLVLLRVYEEFLEYTEYHNYPSSLRVRMGDEEWAEVQPFYALQWQVTQMFGGPPEDAERDANRERDQNPENQRR